MRRGCDDAAAGKGAFQSAGRGVLVVVGLVGRLVCGFVRSLVRLGGLLVGGGGGVLGCVGGGSACVLGRVGGGSGRVLCRLRGRVLRRFGSWGGGIGLRGRLGGAGAGLRRV